MAIPNGYGVDGATIHAKAKSVVVLGYQDDGHVARTQALADMSHGKKFLYLPLNLLCLLGVGAVRKKGSQRLTMSGKCRVLGGVVAWR